MFATIVTIKMLYNSWLEENKDYYYYYLKIFKLMWTTDFVSNKY